MRQLSFHQHEVPQEQPQEPRGSYVSLTDLSHHTATSKQVVTSPSAASRWKTLQHSFRDMNAIQLLLVLIIFMAMTSMIWTCTQLYNGHVCVHSIERHYESNKCEAYWNTTINSIGAPDVQVVFRNKTDTGSDPFLLHEVPIAVQQVYLFSGGGTEFTCD